MLKTLRQIIRVGLVSEPAPEPATVRGPRLQDLHDEILAVLGRALAGVCVRALARCCARGGVCSLFALRCYLWACARGKGGAGWPVSRLERHRAG